MEDLISLWDLMYIKPRNGRYTWTNKIIIPSHSAARLDQFLIKSTFLESIAIFSSKIISWSSFDHRPISLLIKETLNYGPIPFRIHALKE
jgi:hypothetical protein